MFHQVEMDLKETVNTFLIQGGSGVSQASVTPPLRSVMIRLHYG
jgi:hypothetical protein